MVKFEVGEIEVFVGDGIVLVGLKKIFDNF